MSDENKYGVDTKGIEDMLDLYKDIKVATAIGIANTHFSEMKYGKRKFPREKVGELAAELGISTDIIIRVYNLDDKKI